MRKNILIVEDDKEVLDIVVDRLRDEGFNVVGAPTGQGGLEKAKMYLPDLVLLDIMLPDMQGSDVAKMLQEDAATAKIPIIFISGIVAGEGETPSDVNIGGVSYPALGKPFTFRQLMEQIKIAISR